MKTEIYGITQLLKKTNNFVTELDHLGAKLQKQVADLRENLLEADTLIAKAGEAGEQLREEYERTFGQNTIQLGSESDFAPNMVVLREGEELAKFPIPKETYDLLLERGIPRES